MEKHILINKQNIEDKMSFASQKEVCEYLDVRSSQVSRAIHKGWKIKGFYIFKQSDHSAICRFILEIIIKELDKNHNFKSVKTILYKCLGEIKGS